MSLKTEILSIFSTKNGMDRAFLIKTENGLKYYNGTIHTHQKNGKLFHLFVDIRTFQI